MSYFKHFATTILATALAAALSVSQAAQTEFEVDTEHTSVVFLADHLGYARLIGHFRDFHGKVMLDEEDMTRSSVSLVIRTQSIDTGHGRRDDHLRSPDFFNAAEFPEMRFVSTEVEVTGDDTARVTGDLTLLGVTHPLVLEVTFNDRKPHPLTSVDTAGFSARATLRRSEFGMRYALGGIGDEVELWLEVEAMARE